MDKLSMFSSMLIVLAITAGCKPRRDQSAGSSTKDTGRSLADVFLGMEFVPIAPGAFKMSHPRRSVPSRIVQVSGFDMQQTEVTQSQWEAVMGSNPSYFTSYFRFKRNPNNPVEQVSWHMVQDFIAVLNRIPGKYEYQLPTTEQWEYAARAGTTADNLNDLRAMAWHYDNSDGKTHPVATMRANAWGLHDMHGNVKEWTSSLEWPLNPGAKDRIIRGGSYGDPLGECYSFKMAADDPDLETSYVGFRLVRKLKSTPPPEIRTDEYDHTSK